MLRKFWQLMRATWRSLGVVASVIGVLYLWPDIQGLPDAYDLEWGQFMPDREIVAFVLLALALMWIVWIDARPTVLGWMRLRKKHVLGLIPPEDCLIQAEFLHTADKQICWYRESRAIAVTNNTPKHETLRQLQLHITFMGAPDLLPLRYGKEYSIDLHPKAVAYFEIGCIYTDKCRGMPLSTRIIDMDEASDIEKKSKSLNLPLKSRYTGIYVKMPESMLPSSTLHEFPIWLMFTAKDMAPLTMRVSLQHDQEKDVVFRTEVVS